MSGESFPISENDIMNYCSDHMNKQLGQVAKQTEEGGMGLMIIVIIALVIICCICSCLSSGGGGFYWYKKKNTTSETK